MKLPMLQNTIVAAASRPFYRQHWALPIDINVGRIDVRQFQALPVVRKAHLRDHWVDIMVCEDAVDYVSSSGTTGRPVDVPVHRLQEGVWIDTITRVLRELGLQPGDRLLQTLSNNDMFTLGPLINQAAKQLGMSVFRCSPQRLSRIVDILTYHRPTAIVGNPMFLIDIAEQLGPTFSQKVSLPTKAYLAACPTFDHAFCPTVAVEKMQAWWKFNLYINEYGCSEIGSIGHECHRHQGFHINDDYLHVELLDPHTSMPVPDGQPGEVVVTTLTQPRGFSAVRYATGDIASGLYRTPCQCGRTSPRLGAIIGRIDQQFKLNGQNFYPEFVLNMLDGLVFIKYSLLVRYKTSKGEEVIELWLESESEEGISHQSRCELVAQTLAAHVAQGPPFVFFLPGNIQKVIQAHMLATNGVKVPRLLDLSDEDFEHGITNWKAAYSEPGSR